MNYRTWGGALISGALLPFAFAPFSFVILAVPCVACLYYLLLDSTPKQAFCIGWCFGLGAFGAGVSWLYYSFQFANLSLPFAIFCTFGFVVFLALYTGAVGFACARFAGRASRALMLLAVLPAVWTLFEWLRGSFLTGFTWLQLGYSQIDSPLSGYFPLLGSYGVGWLVALTAGTLVLVVTHSSHRVALVLMAALVWGGGYALKQHAWTVPVGEPLAVALAQGNVPQAEKWLPENRQPTLERYLEMSRAHWDADLVVWPETALPGFRHTFSEFLDLLGKEARQNDSDVILGVPIVDAETRRFYNGLVLAGRTQGVYYKHHLVPFGEYLPLDSVLRPIIDALGIPMSNFSRGPAVQPLLEVDGHDIGATICYEIAFGAEVARALPDARFLLTVSNDAWFGDTIAAHQHLEIARARAAETGRYLVRATNTGISAFIDAKGELLSRSAQFETLVLRGDVQPYSGRTPYVVTGDWPLLGLLLFIAIVGCLGARRGG